MANLNKIGLAVAGFLLWYIISILLSWYRLRHVPGPKLASFSYIWIMNKVLWGRGMDYEHLTQYGSLVRIGPNYLVTDDPNVVRQINGARSTAIRDDWYRGSKMDTQDNLISYVDIAPHDALKAKTARAYSGRDKMDFESSVNAQIKHLVDIIRSNYLSSAGQVRPVDFAPFTRYFTLDVITEVAFGKKFGFMDNDDLYGYTSSIDKLLFLITTAGDVPALRRMFLSSFSSWFVAPKPTDKTGLGKLMGIARDIAHSRFEKNDSSHHDMIGSFMRHGLNEAEVKAEVIIQIIAGSDTTATAIRATMLYIMSCPRVYQRLKTEIKEAIESGGVSSPITNEEAKRLPYLQAVIFEGLRMRPPAVYGFYKKIKPEGETINGKFVPGGTAVGWNNPAMMKSESLFGQDAQIFRPERFLECDEEKRIEMLRTVELVFGHGRWMCAGKPLAFIELNKTFFELLRVFDWQLMYPGSPWQEKAYTVWVHTDMWVSITEAETL